MTRDRKQAARIARFASLGCTMLGSLALFGCSGSGDSGGVERWSCSKTAVPLGQTVECLLASETSSDGPAYFCGDSVNEPACPAPENWIRVDGAASSASSSDGVSNPAGSETVSTFDAGFYCTRESNVRRCRRAPVCERGAHRVQMDCEPDASISLGSAGDANGNGYAGESSSDGFPGAQTQCFYTAGATPGSSTPAATFQYVIETVAGAQELHMRLTFSPAFVDNSYGTKAVNWSQGHSFAQLVGSDHTELSFFDTAAKETVHFKMDYISKSASAPSGYACLGVTGGEGRMILGDPSWISKVSSSLDRNLNERGYAAFVTDSPATDATYKPPTGAPKWDFKVAYEAWIKNEAFGAKGFGSVKLAFVHASPSKAGVNTLPVTPGPCPPDWMGTSTGTGTGTGTDSNTPR